MFLRSIVLVLLSLAGCISTQQRLPHQIAVRSHGSMSCSGALVNKNQIIVPSDCIMSGSSTDVQVRYDNITSKHDSGEIYRVNQIRYHPQSVFVDHNKDHIYHRYALLTLDRKINEPKGFKGAKVPKGEVTLTEGQICTTIRENWDLPSSENPHFFPRIENFLVQIMNDTWCQKYHSDFYDSNHICAEPVDSKNSWEVCSAAGAALVCDDQLVGVCSSRALALFIIIIVALIGAVRGAVFAKKWWKRRRSAEEGEDSNAGNSQAPIVKKRLRSLDTFRGLCIVLMVFVNSGAGGYSFLEHATWNGIHFADFIFPWFLWIMGVCIPMSVKSQIARNVSKTDMLLNVLRRSLTLFAIGVCLNTIWGAQLENLRIFGVLQRFGVAFFVVASFHIIFRKVGNLAPQNRIARTVHDVRILLPEWTIMIGILIVHLALIFGLSVPGCGRGYLGPGGMHEMTRYNHCIGGAAGYIDRVILTNDHIYQHPTAKKVYGSEAFDPEGVFGCLMSIFQVFLGLQCGMILLIHSDWRARVRRWTIWGVLSAFIGGALCEFHKEDGLIPINKNMWSLSFVLVTSGLAFILLAVLYVIVDVRGVWRGTPLIQAGMNAIIIYVGHQVFHKMLPWHWSIGPMNTHFVRLLESGWNTMLWVGIAYYLYMRKLFYSI
ncbi:Heparan-alpha-glucosaminide N-acetyltransferase [Sergentomyia squamirostris]